MKYIGQLVVLFFLSVATLSAAPKIDLSGAIDLGNGTTIGVDSGGKIRVRTATGNVVMSTPDSNQIRKATDIYLPAQLPNGLAQPVFGQNRSLLPFDPAYGMTNSAILNRLSAYFSTANGGFGFRISFDRRISPNLRLLASPEFLTYGFYRSAQILGDNMPANTTRITLFSLPFGLQRQFSPKSRVVPHIGFGFGPMMRFDHRPTAYSYGTGLNLNSGYGRDALGVSVPLFAEDYPDISLTVGGHVATGVNIRFGEKKNVGLLVEGRYTLARFFDMLGSPGDFSGFSVGVGLGKYF